MICHVSLLCYTDGLKWKQDYSGLRVEIPTEKFSDIGIMLRVQLA